MELKYTIKSKTVNLTDIVRSIQSLSTSIGIPYTDLVNYKHDNKSYDIPTDCGRITTQGVFKNVDIAVAKTRIDKDSIMIAHTHEEFELVKVLLGSMKVVFKDKEEIKTVNKGEIILIEPNTLHEVYWSEDTVILAITLPASPSWPEGALNVN